MAEPATRDAALSSALDAVHEVRESLEQLRSRLESEEGASDYVAALAEARSLTHQMVELLTAASSRSS